jgi:hypothetical protein
VSFCTIRFDRFYMKSDRLLSLLIDKEGDDHEQTPRWIDRSYDVRGVEWIVGAGK